MKFGKANEIPQVEIQCECDRFENTIRKMGVEFCCEWFGHKVDSEFTEETIRVLLERSNHPSPNASVSIPGGEPGYAPGDCSVAGCEQWADMLGKLNDLSNRLYDEDRGDEGALIVGAVKRLLKQEKSISYYQQNATLSGNGKLKGDL